MIDDIARELDRIVNRLTTVSLDRLAPVTDRCHATASLIVERTRSIDDEVPTIAVPEVGVNALGWQLAVVGNDYLNAARASGDPQEEIVLDALVELRRALP